MNIKSFLDKQSKESFLLSALLFFIFCQHFVSSGAVYRISAWLLFLPAGLWVLLKDKAFNLKALMTKPFFWPISLFFIYAFLHSVYFCLFQDAPSKAIVHCILNCIFVFSVIILFIRIDAKELRRFENGFILFALTSGFLTLALYTFYNYRYFGTRWIGIGKNDHSILGALVFCQSGLLALGVYIKNKANETNPSKLYNAFLLSALAVSTITILLSQSKGVILSFSLSIPILLALFDYKKAAFLSVVLICLSAAFLFFVFIHPEPLFVKTFLQIPFGSEIYERGDSYRMEVWSKAVEFIREKPLFGHGLKAVFPYRFVHPHNLFLAVAYHFGLVGLGFFICLLISVFRLSCIKDLTNNEKIYFVLFCSAVLGGLTDLAKPINGVSILWVILWLPLGIFLGLRAGRLHKITLQQSTKTACQG